MLGQLQAKLMQEQFVVMARAGTGDLSLGTYWVTLELSGGPKWGVLVRNGERHMNILGILPALGILALTSTPLLAADQHPMGFFCHERRHGPGRGSGRP